MIFWLVAILMLLAVIAVLAWPLLRPVREEPAGEDFSLNLTVYRQHLAELAADQESGLLTEEQAGQVRVDLERSLLREIPEGAEAAVAPSPPAPGGRWPLALIAILLTAGSLSLYLDLGSPDLAAGGGSAAAPTSVNEMVSRLERRLRTNPDDVEGWLMLARSYMVLGRYGDAASVLQRLHQKLGDQPVILIRYAHALAMANGGSFTGQPGKLVRRVLEIQPDNPAALWFAGVAANQQGDYRTAIGYWQKLEPHLSGQDAAQQRVRELISEARSNLQGGGGNETGGGKAAPQPAAAGGKSIKVHVTLADALQGKVNPKDTLFIFARAPTGLPMPLAVVKRRAGDLPLDIVLDDSLAMSPQHKLSGQQKVDLVARISLSGSVKRQSGDMQGEKDGVPVDGSDTVPLVIDTRIP